MSFNWTSKVEANFLFTYISLQKKSNTKCGGARLDQIFAQRLEE